MVAKTGKAVLFRGASYPLEVQQLPLPKLRTGELLVKITCCTICGSDLHTYLGHRTTLTPTILGHEIIGEIAEFGPNTTQEDMQGHSLNVGDRITWSIAASCNSCFYCQKGIPQKCSHLFKYGHEKISDKHSFSGGFAEYCHLAQGTAIVKIPDNLPDLVVCPANCATATVAGAFRVGGGCQGKTILIQGLGMLGLTACAMAQYLGVHAILACDVSPERLELAKSFGATHVMKAGESATKDLVNTLTAERGVDLALELSGSPRAIEEGLPLLRLGGHYIWVGAVFPTLPIPIEPERIVKQLIQISGLHNYIPKDLENAVKFLDAYQNRYPFEKLIPHSYALNDVEQALQAATSQQAPRIAITNHSPE